jgi:6-phosphogluconolactonase/glucosamine-6-phosphate isomerase/deaminase
MFVLFFLYSFIAIAHTLVVPSVKVFKTVESLSQGLCEDFISACQTSLAEKNSFHCAVPGGSVLKMLAGLKAFGTSDIDWSKVNLFYVNHKCVPLSDSSATHGKAKTLFLDELATINSIPLKISDKGTNFADNAAMQVIYFYVNKSYISKYSYVNSSRRLHTPKV